MCEIDLDPRAKKHIDPAAARMRTYGLLAVFAATIALLFLCAGVLKFPSIEWIELGNDLPAYSITPPAAEYSIPFRIPFHAAKSTLAAAALVLFLSGGLLFALEAQVSRRMPLESAKVRPHLATFSQRTGGVRWNLPLLPDACFSKAQADTYSDRRERRLS
jgi:hypothetical protein